MEGQPVIEAVLRQLHKIRHGDRSGPLVQFQLDRAVVLHGDLRMTQLLEGSVRLSGLLGCLSSSFALRLGAPSAPGRLVSAGAQGQYHQDCQYHGQLFLHSVILRFSVLSFRRLRTFEVRFVSLSRDEVQRKLFHGFFFMGFPSLISCSYVPGPCLSLFSF